MSRIIARFKEFTSVYKKEINFGLIIFLVATLSFGLGYLANRELSHAPIIIHQCSDLPEPLDPSSSSPL